MVSWWDTSLDFVLIFFSLPSPKSLVGTLQPACMPGRISVAIQHVHVLVGAGRRSRGRGYKVHLPRLGDVQLIDIYCINCDTILLYALDIDSVCKSEKENR